MEPGSSLVRTSAGLGIRASRPTSGRRSSMRIPRRSLPSRGLRSAQHRQPRGSGAGGSETSIAGDFGAGWWSAALEGAECFVVPDTGACTDPDLGSRPYSRSDSKPTKPRHPSFRTAKPKCVVAAVWRAQKTEPKEHDTSALERHRDRTFRGRSLLPAAVADSEGGPGVSRATRRRRRRKIVLVAEINDTLVAASAMFGVEEWKDCPRSLSQSAVQARVAREVLRLELWKLAAAIFACARTRSLLFGLQATWGFGPTRPFRGGSNCPDRLRHTFLRSEKGD